MLRQVLLSKGMRLDKSHAAKSQAELELILSKALKLSQSIGDVSFAFSTREGWDPSLLQLQAAGAGFMDICEMVKRWFHQEEVIFLSQLEDDAAYVQAAPLDVAFMQTRDVLWKITQVRCCTLRTAASRCCAMQLPFYMIVIVKSIV